MQLKSTNTVKNTVAPNLPIIQMWASVPMQKIQTDLQCFLLTYINDEEFEPDFNDEHFLGHSILD